jgi:hypothetical protein
LRNISSYSGNYLFFKAGIVVVKLLKILKCCYCAPYLLIVVVLGHKEGRQILNIIERVEAVVSNLQLNKNYLVAALLWE